MPANEVQHPGLAQLSLRLDNEDFRGFLRTSVDERVSAFDSGTLFGQIDVDAFYRVAQLTEHDFDRVDGGPSFINTHRHYSMNG